MELARRESLVVLKRAVFYVCVGGIKTYLGWV